MGNIWHLFDPLAGLIENITQTGAVRRANKHLAALAAVAADALAVPRRDALAQGAARGKAALDELRASAKVDEESVSFLGGRLAALVDVLGNAANRRAPDDLALKAVKYQKLLWALNEGPLSNKDLATRIGQRTDVMCKELSDARLLGLVDTEKAGRENVNRLTPVARALIEAGVVVSEGDTHSMWAKIVQTPAKNLPKAKATPMPRLEVGGVSELLPSALAP